MPFLHPDDDGYDVSALEIIVSVVLQEKPHFLPDYMKRDDDFWIPKYRLTGVSTGLVSAVTAQAKLIVKCDTTEVYFQRYCVGTGFERKGT